MKEKNKTRKSTLILRPDSYLILDENLRIRVNEAKAKHTRRHIANMISNMTSYIQNYKADIDATTQALEKLAVIQEKEGCTLWEAYQKSA